MGRIPFKRIIYLQPVEATACACFTLKSPQLEQVYHVGSMLMPGRTYQSGSGSYRYGFNGKENDNEVTGWDMDRKSFEKLMNDAIEQKKKQQ